LQSLVNQEATEAPFEVVIIDDGSDIDLRVITDKFVNHLAIQYIKTVHQGIAVARNIGIHTAKGEVIILTDDDVIVNSTFVRAHISEHRQGLEGFANVISEAMVAGIPVIAEKKGGNPEQIIHGETGFLCTGYQQARDFRQLLIQDEILCMKMGENAKKRGVTFDRHIMGRLYDQVYVNLAELNKY
ncbi:hypothetical protein C6H68_21170, partial [Photorhabdus luminescens]